MMRTSYWHVVSSGMAVSFLVALAGCPGPKLPPPTPTAAAPDNSGHDHAHGHAHDEGPHGGHLVEIGDEQLHAEWTHNDASGEVVVYILAGDAKTDHLISDETITITTKIGDTPKPYELAAMSPESGKASRFSLADPSLVEALKAVGPGVEATITVSGDDGESLVGKFEKHEHGGHHH